MGKPESAFKKKETKKSPVGIAAVGMSALNPWSMRKTSAELTILHAVLLIFVVIAPLLIEQLKLLPHVWEFFTHLLARVGLVSK